MVLPYAFILSATFFTSFLISFLAIGRFFLQTPSERSAHTIPTSAFGGVAIFLSVSLGFILTHFFYTPLSFYDFATLGLAGILWVLGVFDDYKHSPIWGRLCGQILFAAMLIFTLKVRFPLLASFSILTLPFTFFVILAFINASNFSDGINGLCSGTMMFWFFWVYYLSHADIPSFLFIAAILGFFLFNFPLGKIFLGDSGSTFLGGAVLTLGLGLSRHVSAPEEFYRFLLIIFSPFAFVFSDVTVTLIKRLFQGYHPFVAHKEHFKQKLIHKLGFSHTGVTLIYLLGSMAGTYFLGVKGLEDALTEGFWIFAGITATFIVIVQWLSFRGKSSLFS